jgi:hypothetical protein
VLVPSVSTQMSQENAMAIIVTRGPKQHIDQSEVEECFPTGLLLNGVPERRDVMT